MFHHNISTENILTSEKIQYNSLSEITNNDIEILINGKKENKKLKLCK